MLKKLLFIGILFVVSLTAIAVTINLDPTISASLYDGNPGYNRGQEIAVKVAISSNPGFKGIYFDLNFDSDVLIFDEVTTTTLNSGGLLKAFSNTKGKVIISYSHHENEESIENDITLFDIYFTISPNAKDGDYNFEFEDYNLVDNNGNIIENVNFINSSSYTVNSLIDSDSYIYIKEPYYNEILYEDKSKLSILYSAKDGYTVALYNRDLVGESHEGLYSYNGVIEAHELKLKEGINTLVAELYSGDGLLSSDLTRVFYSAKNEIIKITSPKNNELLDQGMVDVDLEVNHEVFTNMNVLVNGSPASKGERLGNIGQYYTRIKLKEGINTINATMSGESGQVYKDSIDIYYKKGNNYFRIISPKPEESFKSKEGLKLDIKGEIGSKYSEEIDPRTGYKKENKLTFEVFYNADNKEPRKLISHLNGNMTIEENSNASGSKYIFKNATPISLEDISNGSLCINIYKNRVLDSYESKVSRVVKIDNNPLYINLLQPNVFTNDILETYQDLEDASGDFTSVGNNMELSIGGSFKLNSVEHSIELEKERITENKTIDLENVKTIIKGAGCYYALVNRKSDNTMIILKKKILSKEWKEVDRLDNHYGYSMCKTDLGILIGLADNDNSSGIGLYLLDKSDKLRPIILDNLVLRNVQFIKNIDGVIYLYGNYYNNILSFTTYNLIPIGKEYKLSSVNNISFKNSYIIDQFHLSDDGGKAMIKTDLGQVIFYEKRLNRDNGEYEYTPLPKQYEKSLNAKYVICGDWDNSDYITYLLVQDSAVDVVMVNKISGEINKISSNFNTLLKNNSLTKYLGAGFYNNNFYFLYKEDAKYYLQKGKVFFQEFYNSSIAYKKEFKAVGELNLATDNQLLMGNNFLFTKSDNKVISIFNEYPDSGNCSFNYKNSDIEALKGFSFEVDSEYKEVLNDTNDSTISFRLLENGTVDLDEDLHPWKILSLSELLNKKLDEDSIFKVSSKTITYSKHLKRKEFHIELAEEQRNKYFEFKIDLKTIGRITPEIYKFKVYKKVFPKICRTKTENFTLPIRGIIEDSTVDKVKLTVNGEVYSSTDIYLENGGAFYHNIEFSEVDVLEDSDTSKYYLPITIECYNDNNENKKLDFKVEIVDSKCDIWDPNIKFEENPIVDATHELYANGFSTDKGTISIEANYYGLIKCITGYEIYKVNNEGNEVVLANGLLEKTSIPGLTLPQIDLKLDSGYEIGKINKEDIQLFPGKQYLRIYILNPGGLEKKYIYPNICYNVPENSQKIELFNIDDDDNGLTTNGIPIMYSKLVSAVEGDPVTSFVVNESEISGRVSSNYKTDSLIVKSYNPGLVLIDDQGKESQQIRIKTDMGNRFIVRYKIRLSENKISDIFDVGITPENANMKELKCGFRIIANKNYENTTFTPDFTSMIGKDWQEKIKDSEKVYIPFNFQLKRSDLPTSSYTNGKGEVTARLIVNRLETIEGKVVADNGIYYIVQDKKRQYLVDRLLKEGVNRIQWELYYNYEKNDQTKQWNKRCTISKSKFKLKENNNSKFDDFLFEYKISKAYTPSELTFINLLKSKYYTPPSEGEEHPDNYWPDLKIKKDIRTHVKLGITHSGVEKIFFETEGDSSEIIIDYDKLKNVLKDGKNTLNVELQENETIKKYSYEYFYDTNKPKVYIDSYKFYPSTNKLEKLVVNVDEVNFKNVKLIYAENQISIAPEVVIVSENQYKLIWELDDSTDNYILRNQDIKVRIEDKAGNEETAILKKEERPVAGDGIKLEEKLIKMPIYNIERGYPELRNEKQELPSNAFFLNHTKFAPAKFLRRKVITSELEANDYFLIKKTTSQNINPVYWSKMENFPSVTEAYQNGGIGSAKIDSHQGVYYTCQYGNGLKLSNVTNSITIDNTNNFDSGVISFWGSTNHEGVGSAFITMLFGGYTWLNVGTEDTPETQTSYFGGNHFSDVGGKNHYYIVFDKDKRLIANNIGGHSAVLYVNGQEWITSTVDIPTYSDIKIGMLSSDQAITILDNLKIWDYIPSTTPGWIYKSDGQPSKENVIVTNELRDIVPMDSTQSIFESDYGSFIVFKALKNSSQNTQAGVNNLSDFKQAIKFKVLGELLYRNNPTESFKSQVLTEEISTLGVTTNNSFETREFYYYIVKKNELLEAFNTKVEQMSNPSGTLISKADKRVINPGSLKVELKKEDSPIEADVYLVGKNDSSLKDIVIYDPQYESLNQGDDNFTLLNPKLKIPLEDSNVDIDRSFRLSKDHESLSHYFWLRLEDENSNLNETKYNKIFSLSNNFSLMYKKTSQANVYQLYLKKGDVIIALDKYIEAMKWEMVSLRINEDSNVLRLFLGNAEAKCTDGSSIIFASSIIDNMLKKDAQYYFGSKDDELSMSGFFSIASPFYIDNKLEDETLIAAEIANYMLLKDNIKAFKVIDHNFTFTETNTGLKDFTIIGEEDNNNHVDYYENSNYLEITEIDKKPGSLKASSKHLNILDTSKISEKGIILSGATKYITANVDVTLTAYDMLLKPKTDIGHYYFGNKKSNYGLKSDKCYSISGEVLGIDSNLEAQLVIRINGNEQSFRLEKGKFHFIYENTEEITPYDLVMYIKMEYNSEEVSKEDSTNGLKLSKDMVFNNGNYKINKSLKETAVSENIFFQKSGTIDFWYKPLNYNKNGLVNYESVLIDGKYFKIYSKLDTEGYSVYVAEMKQATALKNIIITTNCRISNKWQHLQLSWDTDNDDFFFYVDEKLAGRNPKTKDGISNFGTQTGIADSSDNFYIGCDISKKIFAEGYIDDLKISNQYKAVIETDRYFPKPIYKPNENKIVFHNPKGLRESLKYSLKSLDDFHIINGYSFDINTINYAPGRYRLTTEGEINGYDYNNIMFFNIDTKPYIKVSSHTPIIFNNLESSMSSNIDFTLRYDNSFKYGNQERLFAGIVITLKNVNGSDNTTLHKYIAEGYGQAYNEWQMWDSVEEGVDVWKKLELNNTGEIPIRFSDVKASGDITYEVKRFYFTGHPNKEAFNQVTDSSIISGDIPLASINYGYKYYGTKDYEYCLEVSVLDKNKITDDKNNNFGQILNNVEIDYILTGEKNNLMPVSNSVKLNNNGIYNFYYDDILDNYSTGEYEIDLFLKYNNKIYNEIRDIPLTLIEPKEEKIDQNNNRSKLEIKDFSKLYIDKSEDTGWIGSFLLEYSAENLSATEEILCTLEIFDNNEKENNPNKKLSYSNTIELCDSDTSKVFSDIKIPIGKSRIKVKLVKDGLIDSRCIDINNVKNAPDVYITNSPKGSIAYNNVTFNWYGSLKDNSHLTNEIEYSYNFDGTGWTEYNTQWKSVIFYELDEGHHNFMVRASHKGAVSDIRYSNFFIDINRPTFNKDRIKVDKEISPEGILKSVKITGMTKAITDVSLTNLFIDGKPVENLDTDEGTFVIEGLAPDKDGENIYELIAVDRVGNQQKYSVIVSNNITEIVFPANGIVKYSPLTIVGKLNQSISAPVDIYVKDPYFAGDGDKWDGWKKAHINEDRTFFVEDINVNPGNSDHEIETELEIACVFENGDTVFTRNYPVKAKNLIMPIVMSLDKYAVQGDNTDTVVNITCESNVENISSWSVDFDGDGLYDQTDLIHGDDKNSKIWSWEHKYSSLGKIHPRVRVITKDGNFFSVNKQLIIHERIINACNIDINNPAAMDTYTGVDKNSIVYVLSHDNREGVENSFIRKYVLSKNASALSNYKFELELNKLGIELDNNGHYRILALEKDHLIVADRFNLFEISQNRFGEYTLKKSVNLFDNGIEISDIARKLDTLYITNKITGSIALLPVYNNSLGDIEDLKLIDINVKNSVPMGINTGIAISSNNILIADFINQRLLELNDLLKVQEFHGSFGTEAGEFLKPSVIESYENRTLVFDEARSDIQVFDQSLQPVATLKYDKETNNEYLDETFFNDIVDINLISRLEKGGKLYYYALILSKSSGALSVLRLPKWEELRARVRNNKIVFLRDGEIYTSKSDEGDLARIISSDSIPMTEGTLEYPALSPDGRSLVFTSLGKLYNGKSEIPYNDNIYNYDNLYIVDIISKDLKQIDLGDFNGHEIERPVFSSNGDKLIFSAKARGSYWQIFTYSFETKEVEQVFEIDANARFPYFSPDDRYIVFSTDLSGNEEIEIIDVENPAIRVSVTDNYSRDSFPVWSSTYPKELSDGTIESKIAFVSERNYHKGIYSVYVKYNGKDDIRIVKANGEDIGSKPDEAAIELTNGTNFIEGDYPCFTGDGEEVIFECYDGSKNILAKYNYRNKELSAMDLKGSIERPAGMKNMITDFKVKYEKGNTAELMWQPYTDYNIPYYIEYKDTTKNETIQKKVYGQTKAVIKGLKMGALYQVRVLIIDQNKDEVATSTWKYIQLPIVSAIPSYTYDENNPYLIKLHGWKPEERCLVENKTMWTYTWIVDNRVVASVNSQDFEYEFATQGPKNIVLKVHAYQNEDYADISSINVDIKSDIKPIITYKIAEDGSAIELDASLSKGNKINFSDVLWTVTSPGYQGTINRNERLTSINLDGFKRKIYVTLKLKRIAVNDQQTTDVIEKTKVIDLDVYDVKPIITTEVNSKNHRRIKFSGENSFGNIDWRSAKWSIYSDSGPIAQYQQVSEFYHTFSETSDDKVYYVNLSLSNSGSGLSKTISKVVNVAPTPIEPVIEHEILTLRNEDNKVIGAKLLLNCTNSKGSNIDFSRAEWKSVTLDGNINEEKQYGATASYTFMTAERKILRNINLTLYRKDDNKPLVVTKLISVDADSDIETGKLKINKACKDFSNGKVITLDVLSSTGPNINWKETTWSIEGQPYDKKGPMVKIEVPFDQEDRNIDFVCTLHRFGGEIQTIRDYYEVDNVAFSPFLDFDIIDGNKNLFKLSVLETRGMNIDWERTRWFIYNGNTQVIEKRGPEVIHGFNYSDSIMGYPVSVEMYLKGASKPIIGYGNVPVQRDELRPIIKETRNSDNSNIITFDASSSVGHNIDWPRAKWTFGDSSEYQYGSTVVHTYPNDSDNSEYRVTLTLSRNSSNGSVETKTLHRNIDIGSNEIVPKIKAVKRGNTIFLSAEESEGHGLMIERSLWNFDGKGDSGSRVENIEEGRATRSSTNLGAGISTGVSIEQNVGFGVGQEGEGVGYWNVRQGSFISMEASMKGNIYSDGIIDRSYDYFRGQESFSSQNSHVGATCRRSIIDTSDSEKTIFVSLTVFRVESDGGIKAETITVAINPNNVQSIYQ